MLRVAPAEQGPYDEVVLAGLRPGHVLSPQAGRTATRRRRG
ncbi:hypothetical protein [Streptomyces sp. x-80]